CRFKYTVDMSRDNSLYDLQKEIENYLQTEPHFNPNKKNHRDWQTSNDPTYNKRYIMTSPTFIRHTPYNVREEKRVSYSLHLWIKAGLDKTPGYFANPDRPVALEYRDGRLIDIKKCKPPYLQWGDLIWISFTVLFAIGPSLWAPEFTPIEFIWVGVITDEV
ncbi:hypothetical protein BKA93DRAFT_716610, partial [Sparassis latifolia]